MPSRSVPDSSSNIPSDVVDEPLDFEELDEAPDASGWVPPEVPWLRVAVGAEGHGRRIDQWLVTQVPTFSRSHLKHLIEAGAVLVDGVAVTSAARKLQAGQQVVAELRPTAQSTSFTPEAMDLDILFEDDHLMVVNKPVGLVVHPAAGNWQGTLLNGLLAHHRGAAQLPRAGIVHRLDKDTSGLMVVGKTQEACVALTKAIALRDVHRQYRALVWGEPPESFRVDLPIGRDLVSRVRMGVVKGGKPAMTDVVTIATLPVEQKFRTVGGVLHSEISAVECTLHTGRTHQIRVHLSSRHHPLVADSVYGGKPELGMTRQALHAFRLSLVHPHTGEALSFEAEMPADMACAWAQVVHNEAPSA